MFVFPDRISVKSSLFPIAILLARGNAIALAPAVLATIYKDLTLFKKTIVDFSKSFRSYSSITLLFGSNLGVGEVQKFTTTTHVDQPRGPFFV